MAVPSLLYIFYTVSQKHWTAVTFSNDLINVDHCLQRSRIQTVRFGKTAYQLRLFPWQRFTTDKLKTVVKGMAEVF